MSNVKYHWHEHFIDALNSNRPDSIITGNIDQVLQWLGQSNTTESREISESIKKFGQDESQLRSVAFLLLEAMLFTNVDNPYDVFTAKTGTDAKELKTRYQRFMKVYHPDLGKIGDVKKRTAIAEIINKAYDDIKNNRYSSQNSKYQATGEHDSTAVKKKSANHKSPPAETNVILMPAFIRKMLDRYKNNPDLASGNLKKSFLWVSSIAMLFFLFTLISNPANETVNDQYQSYIKNTVEKKRNGNSAKEAEIVSEEQIGITETNVGMETEFRKEFDDVGINSVETIEEQAIDLPEDEANLTLDLANDENEILDSEEAVISNEENSLTGTNAPDNFDNNEAIENISEISQVETKIKSDAEITPSQTIQVESLNSKKEVVETSKKQIIETPKEQIVKEQEVNERSKFLLALSAQQTAESEIKKVINSFEQYYNSGDASKLASLYAPLAQENQYSSREQIRQVYEKYFSSLSSQNISFYIKKIKSLDNDQYFVSGSFIGATKKNLFKSKSFNADFSLLFAPQNNEMKILKMNY